MKKLFLLSIAAIMVLSLAACGDSSASSEATNTSKVATPSEATTKETNANNPVNAKTDSGIKSAFTYSINDETYTEEGIAIKFPQLINVSDPKKADLINKAIQDDIKEELSSLRDDTEDMGAFSLDLKYELENYNNKVLSISFQGVSNFEKSAYPVNIYHTLNINIEDSSYLSLKDLFTIDNTFVSQFKNGKYLPANEDLNLEKEGVNPKETIEGQYSNEDLISLFQKETANYKLTKTGLILSVEVPHAIGDHLEMIVDYGKLRENFVKNSPIWEN